MKLLYLAITIKLAPELRIFIFYMMELLSSPETWVALLTLTILEIVLGIDNIVFISIISDKLPKEKQKRARKTGLALALITRILLLLSLSWVMSLTDPLFNVLSNDISGRDLILLIGGLFLIYKSVKEIHGKLEGEDPNAINGKNKGLGLPQAIIQIMIIDAVFSFDSVITAGGTAQHVEIMIAAVIIAMLVMFLFSPKISNALILFLMIFRLSLQPDRIVKYFSKYISVHLSFNFFKVNFLIL